jgi:hypothetical protein
MILSTNNHYETECTFLNLKVVHKKAMKLDTNYLSLRSIKSVFKAIKKKALNSALYT